LSTWVISIFIGGAVFVSLSAIFKINFFADLMEFSASQLSSLWRNLEKYNQQRHEERIKRGNIVRRNEDLFFKYNRLIDNFLRSLNLAIPLETATSLIAILFALIVVVFSIFIGDVTVALIFAVSIMIVMLTWFSRESRVRSVALTEAIADTEDAICPVARDGVLIGIKKVLETDGYIHKSIRPYFVEFVDNCETRGYSFKQAMERLNRQLGSRFNNFAEKAIVFELSERRGMADIFYDIIDQNAVIRQINVKKEEVFKKMNREFLMKTMIVIAFLIFALTLPEFNKFMMSTTAGKFINALCLNVICVSFAWGQALQSSLGLKRQLPKKKVKR